MTEMTNCNICNVFWFQMQNQHLFGEVSIYLCPRCTTAFSGWLLDQPIYEEYTITEARIRYELALAQSGAGVSDEYLRLCTRQLSLTKKAHNLVIDWVVQQKTKYAEQSEHA